MRKQRLFGVVIGAQGMGKSTYAKGVYYRQRQPVLIYDNPNDPTFSSFPLIKSVSQYQGPCMQLKRSRIQRGMFVGNVLNGVTSQGIVLQVGPGKVVLDDYLSGTRKTIPLQQGFWYQDKFRVGYQVKYEEYWELVNTRVRNSFIGVMDATKFERGLITDSLRSILYELRHYGLDVLMLFHNNIRIPKEVMEVAHLLVKFREGKKLAEERFEGSMTDEQMDKMRKLWKLVENYPIREEKDQYFSAAIMLVNTKDFAQGLIKKHTR